MAAITSKLSEVHGAALSLAVDLGIVQSITVSSHSSVRRLRLRIFDPVTFAVMVEQEFGPGDTTRILTPTERFEQVFALRTRPNGVLATVMLQPFYEFTGV